MAISTVPDFINTMNEIYTRSRYIDTLQEVVQTAGSLKFLYYYRPLLQDHWEEVFRTAPDQIRFCWVYPRLAGEFCKNAVSYYPQEVS